MVYKKYINYNTLRLLDKDNDNYTFYNLSEDCSKYVSGNSTDDDAFKADWLSDMSCYNLDSYYNVFKEKLKEFVEKIQNIIVSRKKDINCIDLNDENMLD